MTEDLEYLKSSANNYGSPNLNNSTPSGHHPMGLMPGPGAAGVGDKGWGSRRSNKVVKMELLDLQRNLQSEIRAKQQINEELTKTRSAYLATKQRLEEADSQVADLQRELDRKDLQLEDLQRQIGMQLGGMVEYVDSGVGRDLFRLVNDGTTGKQIIRRADTENGHNLGGSGSNFGVNDYELANSMREVQQRDSMPNMSMNTSAVQPPTYENSSTMPSGLHHRHTPPNTFGRGGVQGVSPRGNADFCIFLLKL